MITSHTSALNADIVFVIISRQCQGRSSTSWRKRLHWFSEKMTLETFVSIRVICYCYEVWYKEDKEACKPAFLYTDTIRYDRRSKRLWTVRRQRTDQRPTFFLMTLLGMVFTFYNPLGHIMDIQYRCRAVVGRLGLGLVLGLRLGLIISVEYSQCALLSICAVPSRIKCRPLGILKCTTVWYKIWAGAMFRDTRIRLVNSITRTCHKCTG